MRSPSTSGTPAYGVAIAITLDGQVAVYERGEDRQEYLPLAGPYDPPASLMGDDWAADCEWRRWFTSNPSAFAHRLNNHPARHRRLVLYDSPPRRWDFTIERLADLVEFFGANSTEELPYAVAREIAGGGIRLQTRTEHWLERPDDVGWRQVKRVKTFMLRARFRNMEVTKRVDFPIMAKDLRGLVEELQSDAELRWRDQNDGLAPNHATVVDGSSTPHNLYERAEYWASRFESWGHQGMWEELNTLPPNLAVVLALWISEALAPKERAVFRTFARIKVWGMRCSAEKQNFPATG